MAANGIANIVRSEQQARGRFACPWQRALITELNALVRTRCEIDGW